MLFVRLGRIISEFDNLSSDAKTRGLAQTFLSEIEEVSKTFKSNHEQIYDHALSSSVSIGDVPYLMEDLYTTFVTKFLVAKGALILYPIFLLTIYQTFTRVRFIPHR